jgi:hypothetical protein
MAIRGGNDYTARPAPGGHCHRFATIDRRFASAPPVPCRHRLLQWQHPIEGMTEE